MCTINSNMVRGRSFLHKDFQIYSAAKHSDFVQILGFLSLKITQLAYANEAYWDFSAIYSHKANTFVSS